MAWLGLCGVVVAECEKLIERWSDISLSLCSVCPTCSVPAVRTWLRLSAALIAALDDVWTSPPCTEWAYESGLQNVRQVPNYNHSMLPLIQQLSAEQKCAPSCGKRGFLEAGEWKESGLKLEAAHFKLRGCRKTQYVIEIRIWFRASGTRPCKQI